MIDLIDVGRASSPDHESPRGRGRQPVLVSFVMRLGHSTSGEVLRVAFPWHLGTRRLTTHRPMGVEAVQLDLRRNRRGSRMGSTRCCQPDGRDPRTHAHFGGQAADETRRVHAPRRNTPLRGRPHTVAAGCFRPDIHLQSGGSEKIILQRFSSYFQSRKAV